MAWIDQYEIRDFPLNDAEHLIVNPDTGERKIAGPILKACYTVARNTMGGTPCYAIGLNVGRNIVCVVHQVDDASGPLGSGLWAAVDDIAVAATSFPLGGPVADAVEHGAVAAVRSAVADVL